MAKRSFPQAQPGTISHRSGAPHRGKTVSLIMLLLAQVCAMGVWFSSSAAISGIQSAFALTSFDEALLTSLVQIGFVAGTIVSAILTLADRFNPRLVFALSSFGAAIATGSLAFLPPIDATVISLRFLTGVCMAGVYPVGIRLVSTWADRDLGLLIGLLVGALTLGSASPYFLAATVRVDWRTVYLIAAAFAAVSAGLVGLARLGPNMKRATTIDIKKVTQSWRYPPLRLANAGYLGHMWELYAMWAWISVFFHESFAARQLTNAGTRAALLTFAVIAIGAVGAWLGGFLADRLGRTSVTITSMAVSGTCALLMGWLYTAPFFILIPIALIWGVSVIADSAQFSAAIAELAEPSSVGTLLTAQTCAGFLLTTISIHLVTDIQAAFGWPGAFSMLALGPAIGCLAMWRLRSHPEAIRLANGRR